MMRREHLGRGRRLAEIVHQHREAHVDAATQFHRLAQRQQLVHAGVDLRVPFLRLRHAEQCVDLREDHLQRAAGAQYADEHFGVRFAQRLLRLGPDPLGHQGVGLAGVHHAAHQRHGLPGDLEAQRRITRGETRHAQDAHRIFGERLGDVAQLAGREIALTVVGIDHVAVRVLGHGVDGEIAAPQVVLERDVG
jgi:hypothetical protein